MILLVFDFDLRGLLNVQVTIVFNRQSHFTFTSTGGKSKYSTKKPHKKLTSNWTFWEEPDLSVDLIDNLTNNPPANEHSNNWIPSENFSKKTIQIPKGWFGEIKYKVLVERKGLEDLAGEYSGSIDISIDSVNSDD